MGRYHHPGPAGGLTPPLSASPVYCYGTAPGSASRQYLDVYGGGSSSGSVPLTLSRATTPQRAMMSAIAAARLGGLRLRCVSVPVVALYCVRSIVNFFGLECVLFGFKCRVELLLRCIVR